MMQVDQPELRRIETAVPGPVLIELIPAHATAYHRLLSRNIDHLTRYGDYGEARDATPASVVQELAEVGHPNFRYGIWMDGELIGRVDLSPRVPGHFVIGYWLGSDFTGKGYATAACSALIDVARTELAATAIYAGVTKGNLESERLLERLQFERYEYRESFILFRRVF